MSYCRAGDDSDLYCFKDVRGGRTTYVATRPELPYAGEIFHDPTLEAFRARVVMLRDAGYQVPDDVLPMIDAEIRARDEEGQK